VADRQVAEQGDVAVVDSEATVDGAPLKGAKREGGSLEVEPGTLLDGKAEVLLGAHLGETREAAVTFPNDYGVQDLRGKEAQFKLTLKGLKRREVPALDDAFVQDLGMDAKTLPELQAKIRADLAEQQKDRQSGNQREALLAALIEKNPLEAPPALVERNVDAMLEGMLSGFQRRGLDVNKLGLNVERLREDLRGRALLEVKGYLLLEAIAEKEALVADEKDIEAHYEKMAAELKQPVEKIKAVYRRNEEAREGIAGRIRQDKALAFLLAKANLT
jgi:trigger factor